MRPRIEEGVGRSEYGLHGENASATADIEYDLVLEQMLVLDNGIHVGARADFIFLERETMVSGRPNFSELLPNEIRM